MEMNGGRTGESWRLDAFLRGSYRLDADEIVVTSIAIKADAEPNEGRGGAKTLH